MKKILPILVLGSLLVGIVVPIVALAQEKPLEKCTLGRAIKYKDLSLKEGVIVSGDSTKGACTSDTAAGTECYTKDWGTFCLLNTMYSITDWVFVLIIVLASVFIIVGAVMFVTAAGAPEKVASARNYLIYAAVGIAVALLSKVIPAIVKGIIG